MKLLFAAFFLFISCFGFSQNLKNFVVPKGFKKIAEAKGDLDKDGIEEIVLAFDTTKTVNSDFARGKVRKLYILKKVGKELKIWKENTSVLFPSETGFYPENNPLPKMSIAKNVLKIEQSYNSNSRHSHDYTTSFRYQNNDFHVIGSSYQRNDTCEFDILNEINFSTGKAVVEENYYPCFEDSVAPEKDFHKVFVHKLKTLPKMNNFEVGSSNFKIPNSQKYFIY